MPHIRNTQTVAMPTEFIGHERRCEHCGTDFAVYSRDAGYLHTASHSRMEGKHVQTRHINVHCPTCRMVLTLTTTIQSQTSTGASDMPELGG